MNIIKRVLSKMKSAAMAPFILKERLDTLVVRPEYQRGAEKWQDGRLKTFCNLLGWYLLDDRLPKTKYGPFVTAYKKDITPMLRDGKLSNITLTPIPLAYSNIIDNGVQCVTAQEAQKLANKGIPVMAICDKPGYAHVAMVYPTTETYDPAKGPKVAQAGWFNFADGYISDEACWGRFWKVLGVLYVVFKDR